MDFSADKLRAKEMYDLIKKLINKDQPDLEELIELEKKFKIQLYPYEFNYGFISRSSYFSQNSLERIKGKNGQYSYFIVDKEGKQINEIDSKYFSSNLIGSIKESDYFEIENNEIEYEKNIYCFYDFHYAEITPKYRIEKEGINKKVEKIDWEIPDEDIQSDDDIDSNLSFFYKNEKKETGIFWNSKSGKYEDENFFYCEGNSSLSKCIINDDGEIVKDNIDIQEPIMHIENIGFLIKENITPFKIKQGFENKFSKPYLFSLIDYYGNTLMSSTCKIEYLLMHNLFLFRNVQGKHEEDVLIFDALEQFFGFLIEANNGLILSSNKSKYDNKPDEFIDTKYGIIYNGIQLSKNDFEKIEIVGNDLKVIRNGKDGIIRDFDLRFNHLLCNTFSGIKLSKDWGWKLIQNNPDKKINNILLEEINYNL
jgi:hypothetical protein